ncbi:hypothetical protein ACIQU1_08785 [Streptomyces angustmyceticus]|uniref:hypothetical protein n=1 Tax=Streptomyces angustmyceticus TaxID=285578 RepID=UPI00382A779A
MLHTLHWPEEIRDPGDLSSPAPTTDRELEIAELLMTEMAGVDITDLHDDYAQALNLLVDTLGRPHGHAAAGAAATGGPDGRAGGIRPRCPALSQWGTRVAQFPSRHLCHSSPSPTG